MSETSTILVSHPYPPTNSFEFENGEPCQIAVEFSEEGWRVLKDNRPTGYKPTGYLHVNDMSAESITDEVRDEIVKYYYQHPKNLPGIGATPQRQYMRGLSIDDRERIGNDGRSSLYAR